MAESTVGGAAGKLHGIDIPRPEIRLACHHDLAGFTLVGLGIGGAAEIHFLGAEQDDTDRAADIYQWGLLCWTYSRWATGRRSSRCRLLRGGGWCPYCNVQLRAYQSALPEIAALGGRIIAISPQLPDASLSVAEKKALDFPVLGGAGKRIA